MSFYYKPEWCLYAAAEVERNQAAKKRFVDEYESNICYRKEAKKLLEGKIAGLTEVGPSHRADTVKTAAVMSYLLFSEKKPKWTKLVLLLGRDFSYMPRMVSAMYAGTRAAYDFTDELNKPENVAKRYLFFCMRTPAQKASFPRTRMSMISGPEICQRIPLTTMKALSRKSSLPSSVLACRKRFVTFRTERLPI